MELLPLHASLPVEQQRRVFEKTKPGTRKIILATNVAETSITIDGIVYVVDSGKVKMKMLSPKSGIDVLTERAVTRFMATQRKGRAGRTGPGHVYRLYTMLAGAMLDETVEPEILRSDMASIVLDLMSNGIKDVKGFPWLTPPNPVMLDKAMKFLLSLGAITKDGTALTDHGRQLAKLPVSPRLGNLVLSGIKFGCLAECLTIVAMLSAEATFQRTTARMYDASGGSSAGYVLLPAAQRDPDAPKVDEAMVGPDGGSEISSTARGRVVSRDGDHPTPRTPRSPSGGGTPRRNLDAILQSFQKTSSSKNKQFRRSKTL
eukprot:Selendium_serpulae@DN4634_c0_g1_i1.p1